MFICSSRVNIVFPCMLFNFYFFSIECYSEEGASICRNESLYYYNQSCLPLYDYCLLGDLQPLNETHCRDSSNTFVTSVDKVVTRISASEDFFRYEGKHEAGNLNRDAVEQLDLE